MFVEMVASGKSAADVMQAQGIEKVDETQLVALCQALSAAIYPTVITIPTDGSTVSGQLTVTANVSDNIEVASVVFRLSNNNSTSSKPVLVEAASATVSAVLDTTTAAGLVDGSATLAIDVFDAAGRSVVSADSVSTTITAGFTRSVAVSNSPIGSSVVSRSMIQTLDGSAPKSVSRWMRSCGCSSKSAYSVLE